MIANRRHIFEVLVRWLCFKVVKRTKLSLSFKMDVIKKRDKNSCPPKKALTANFNVLKLKFTRIFKTSDGDNNSSLSRITTRTFNKLVDVYGNNHSSVTRNLRDAVKINGGDKDDQVQGIWRY